MICLHIGSSSTQIEIAPGAPIDVMITLTPLNTMQAATDLLWSPVLRKFPNLQFALSEGGTGWIPYWLERIDYVYHQHRFWTGQDFGDTLPSQVARDHFSFCFISDRSGVDQRDAIGIDKITWECDYPHSDSSGPTPPSRWPSRWPASTTRSNKLTHENAMRIYQFDPFLHRAARAGHGRGAAARGAQLATPLARVRHPGPVPEASAPTRRRTGSGAPAPRPRRTPRPRPAPGRR